MELDQVTDKVQALRTALQGVVVGQDDVVDQVIVAVVSGGHVLLEGPPGTAKTLLIRALAQAVHGKFRRAQFIPDLMPSDLLGVNVFEQATAQFAFRAGPIFCDLLLADEVNRAPAKTQSALLEAMQERQVSIDGQRHPLSSVFTVFATQNPIEYEGTYPLPEAQLDRFMFKTIIGYPEARDEHEILRRYQNGFDAVDTETFGIAASLSTDELAAARRAVRGVRVQDEVMGYITTIVRATRDHHLLTLGASPRACVMLMQAAQGLAAIRARDFVTPDDVRDLARPVLRHRVVLNPEAEIEGVTADQCTEQILQRIEVPRI